MPDTFFVLTPAEGTVADGHGSCWNLALANGSDSVGPFFADGERHHSGGKKVSHANHGIGAFNLPCSGCESLAAEGKGPDYLALSLGKAQCDCDGFGFGFGGHGFVS